MVDLELQKEILAEKKLNGGIAGIIETLKHRDQQTIQDIKNWEIEEVNGQTAVFFKGKLYIPKNI